MKVKTSELSDLLRMTSRKASRQYCGGKEMVMAYRDGWNDCLDLIIESLGDEVEIPDELMEVRG